MKIHKAALFSCLFLTFQVTSFSAVSRQPWIGNLFEFQGSVSQSHTQSHSINTRERNKKKALYSDMTTMKLSAVPMEQLSVALELDFTKTKSHHFGFDAFKASARYDWLDDVAGDAISLTTGIATSFSTASRIADLSSQNHGVAELEVNSAVGKEFGYSDSGFYRVWAAGFAGIANQGSPWIGMECRLEKVIRDSHFIALFLQAEKGLSPGKLSKETCFRRWASIGYEFEEVGVRYSFKKYALGTAYTQVTKRVHARFCPDNSWSFQIGVNIPFSIL